MTQIGIVGFNTDSGLGVLNRQFIKFLGVRNWLVRRHRCFPKVSELPPELAEFSDDGDFLRQVDVVLFAENPLGLDLARAKAMGKRVVCVPMQEWVPEKKTTWIQYVDLFICPTEYCFESLRSVLPCVHTGWPIDSREFRYIPREVCNRFLFLHGHGGKHDRKGKRVIEETCRRLTNLPITIYTQANVDKWQPGLDVRPAVVNPRDLYRDGDVLLAPHCTDGIGLELLEALACGLPIVVPDAPPWAEFPAIARIETTASKIRMLPGRRETDWYTSCSQSLADICQDLLCKSVLSYSKEGRLFAIGRDWGVMARYLKALVLGDPA